MTVEGIKIIGLCGRSGSGKGYVSRLFSLFKIPAIDTDQVYRDIISGGAVTECVGELVSVFGSSIIDEEGRLVRKRLAAIVFAEGARDKLTMLNSITHKYILAETLRLCNEFKNQGKRAVIIDAPVLFESGFDFYCDIKLCVTADDAVLIKRICERDGIPEFEAKRRLENQMSCSELRRLCHAEIVNNGEADLLSQIKEFLSRFQLLDDPER